MCGRYGLYDLGPWSELSVTWPAGWKPSWNVGPGDAGLVIRHEDVRRERHDDARYRDEERLVGELLTWGLAPWWSTPTGRGGKWINARMETVAERRVFQDAFRHRRCLVLANGFYEWSGEPDERVPHWITVDWPGAAMAGIWERTRLPNGTSLRTFCVLTCPSNALVSPWHARMPVFLEPKSFARWLDPATHRKAELADLFVPPPSFRMRARDVSPRVNDRANQGPSLLDEWPAASR